MQESRNQPLALPGSPADSSTSRHSLMLPPLVNAVEVPDGPPALHAAPTVGSLLHSMRRRWLLATLLGLLGAFLGVLAVLYVMPPQYLASSRITVASRPEVKVFGQTPQEDDFAVYKLGLAAFVKSPLVISAAVNQVKDLPTIRSMGKPVSWLETALKTDYLLAPETLRLSLSGDDPDEVAKIVNAVTDAFIKEMEQRQRSKKDTIVEELNNNIRAQQRLLNQKKQALRKVEQSLGLEDPISLQSRWLAAMQNLALARKAVTDKKVEQISAQEDLRGIEDNLKDINKIPVPPLQLAEALKKHPVAEKVYHEIFEAEKKIKQIESSAAPSAANQLTAQEREHKKNLEKTIKRLLEENRPELEQQVRGEISVKMQLTALELVNRIKSFQKQYDHLVKEADYMDKETQKLSPASNPQPLHVIAMRDEITGIELGLNELGKAIAAHRVEPVLGTRVSVLQRAEPPTAKDMSRQVKLAGVAGFGLAGLMLFGVAWLEFRSRRITAADEVVRGLHMNLVGTLPPMPPVARGPVTNGTMNKDLYWQSQLTESVDSIRTMLLHAARTESLHVVMVTSALEGEGKTSVASQLAASLARAWRKTLLIDADLRKPALHQMLGVSQEPGLSEVLRGETKPEDVIRPTALSRLWLLPAGHWDAHAVQALAQDGVRDLFQKLKEQYDFIIVDSSPVLPVADSLLLAQHVEGVIFSILRDVSRVPSVYGAQQRLGKLGVRILGAVVIGDSGHVSPAYQYLGRSSS